MAGHKKWTPEEDEKLERLYKDPALELKAIVVAMGRHRNQVMRRATKLGLELASSLAWPEEHDLFIEDHVGERGVLWCSKKLGRTEESVRMRCRRLKLKTADARDNLWSEEEDLFIVEKRKQGVGFQEIGETLGRTQEAARYRHKVLRGVAPSTTSLEESWYLGLPTPSIERQALPTIGSRHFSTDYNDSGYLFSKSVNVARRFGPYVVEIKVATCGFRRVTPYEWVDWDEEPGAIPPLQDGEGWVIKRGNKYFNPVESLFFKTLPDKIKARLLDAGEIADLDDGLPRFAPNLPGDSYWESYAEEAFLFRIGSDEEMSLINYVNNMVRPEKLWFDANGLTDFTMTALPRDSEGRQIKVLDWLAQRSGFDPDFALRCANANEPGICLIGWLAW